MFSFGFSNLWLAGCGDGAGHSPASAGGLLCTLPPGSPQAHHLAGSLEQVANFC